MFRCSGDWCTVVSAPGDLRRARPAGEGSPSREGSPQNSFAPTRFEQLMGSLKVARPLKEGEAADPTLVAKQVRVAR